MDETNEFNGCEAGAPSGADPYYRWLCSALTLQSDKKGFFQEFADSVSETVGPEWIKRFGKLNSDRERIIRCYTDDKTYGIVEGTLENVRPLFRTKTAVLSKQRREEALHLQYSGKLSRALLMANQAVIRAPPTGADTKVDDGFSLALALWVRSKILFEKKDYEHCLVDIQLGLKHKLPDQHKLEAYMQMGQCYLEMGEGDKAKVSLTVVNRLAKQTSDSEVAEKTDHMLQDLASFVNQNYKKKPSKKVLPAVTDAGNKDFPNATSGVAVATSKSGGRAMTATARIKTGDTIVAEPPFAAVLLTEKHGTHCLNCFARIEVAVPCLKCSGVAFCSVECEQLANASYHKWECPYTELQIGSGMSVLCYLALRIITQLNMQYLNKVKPHVLDHKAQCRNPYVNMHRLEGHTKEREPKDFLHRTLMALFLLRILRDSGFFGEPLDKQSDKLSEDEIFVGGQLLRHLQVLQYNAHEIYETVMKSENDFKTCKTVYIGIGIYPTVSLFNHECYPAVTRHFVGKSIVIKACRPLMPGEMVAENYGPVFTMRNLAQRQRSLASRYLFECTCKACSQDWPTLEQMNNAATPLIKFRCPNKSCQGSFAYKEGMKEWKCNMCKGKADPRDINRLYTSYNADYERALPLLEQGRLPEVEKAMVKFVDDLLQIARPPLKNLHMAQEALRTCWANEGNVFVLP